MNNKRLLSRVAARLIPLLCLLSLTFPTVAGADTVTDRLAITDVLTQYSYRWDGKDAAGFAGLFTDDAVIERHVFGELVPGSRLVGKEAIYQYAVESHGGRLADRQSRHHFSGIVFVELDADSAVTENMALITHQTASDSAAVIRSSGIYRNTWRRTAEGWRISRRILFTDRFRAE